MADFRIRLLAGTAVALTGAAFASGALADTSLGWYVAVDAGHGPTASQSLKVSDVTLTSTPPGATPPLADGSYKLTPDYAGRGFARAGYRFTPNLRAEVEYGNRPGTLINGLGGGETLDMDRFDKTSLMANAIVDLWPESGIHPFVGVGAGVVKATTDYHETVTTTGHTYVYSTKADKTLPAAQFLAGASLDVTQRLHFDMTYRYLRTGSTSYDIAASDTHGGVTDTYTAKGQGPIADQSLTVGFRWTFGAPLKPRSSHAETSSTQTSPASLPTASTAPSPATKPPASAVAPATTSASQATAPKTTTNGLYAAAARSAATTNGASTSDSADYPDLNVESGEDSGARTAAPNLLTAPKPHKYTTYFPLGGSRLDAAAQSVVIDAAQYAQSAPDARVRVDGYADTSGSMAYNLVLSRRRATMVAQSLTDNGVPSDAITVAWHGETQLAVKTGDGVTKARNRRVTVKVQFGAKAKPHTIKHRRHKHRRAKHR